MTAKVIGGFMEGAGAVRPECSVIVPLYNEERTLPTLHLRLTATLRQLAIPYELIYIDDGSTDETAAIITELHDQDESVKGIFLSRHFGFEGALCAGMDSAGGRAVVMMTGSLGDPPEVIPQLIDKWRDGYQLVVARRKRNRGGLIHRLIARMLHKVLKRATRLDIRVDVGHFAILDREVVEQWNQLPERSRFVPGLQCWVGFKKAEITFDREMPIGTPGRLIRKFLQRTREGLFGFSTAPLRAVTTIGVLTIFADLVCVTLATAVLGIDRVIEFPWMWMGAGLTLLAGVQLIGMGILGEYIARIHRDVQNRPLYLARQRLGFAAFPRAVPNVLNVLPTDSTELQEKATITAMKARELGDFLRREARN